MLNDRQDLLVMAFSLIYIAGIIGAMYGWGMSKGWSASNPILWPNQDRFWPKPGTNGTVITNCTDINIKYDAPLRRVTENCYSQWYYWQLPQDEANALTRSVVWLLYTVHQLFHWILQWLAQEEKKQFLATKESVYSGKLRWFNWSLLAVTYVAHIVHLVQTHTTYDPMAKDLIIQSSQGSVIMMLVFVMCIEYRDRGMFLGWPNLQSDDIVAKKIRLSTPPMEYVRKYHGYFFSWAVIYTFWYHPMENTYGHALGFMHTYFVMVQGSLIYQKVHLNKYWRLFIESWVWWHGFSVATMLVKTNWWQDRSIFMFGYGFGTLFFITQIFGLPFWKDISFYWRLIPSIGWILFTIIFIVAQDKIPNNFLMTLVVIPAGQWGCAFASWLITWVFMKILPKKLGQLGVVFQAFMTCLIYSIFFIAAFLCQIFATSVQMPFMAMTYIMVFMFMIGAIFTWFCFPAPENLPKNEVSPTSTEKTKVSKE